MTKNKRPPPTKSNRKKTLLKIDIPRIICIHLIGEDHTLHHRMGAGIIMMTIGVVISHLTGDIYIIHYIGEIVGFGVHGIGTIPFGEALVAHVGNIRNKVPELPNEEDLKKIEETEKV